MISSIVDPCMVLALMLNFYVLGAARLRSLIVVVALQGVLLGLMYPIVHQGFLPDAGGLTTMSPLGLLRLGILTAAIIGIKGVLIPKMLFKAVVLGVYNPPFLTEWVASAVQFLQRTPDGA